MKEITFEKSLEFDNPLYVDVRSPGEYLEDHIPGAVNLPIFDNDERKEVGTLYKVVGRETAVIRGTEIGGRRIGDIINRLAEERGREIVIYCARGGMRSSSVASLVNALGIGTCRIIDGYKSYRRYVNSRLSSVKFKPRVFVLQGLTGAGKTGILKLLKNSIDLEGMAGHRSSVFGGIGLAVNTQKYFETQLLSRIDALENEAYVVIEGESKKIGNLNIPENIFAQMKDAPVIYIDTPLERRIAIIRDEYARFGEHERIIEIVNSLRGKIGHKKADTLAELYESGKIDEFIEILLLEYYDVLYRHTLDKLEYLSIIRNDDTAQAASDVEKTIHEYLGKHQEISSTNYNN